MNERIRMIRETLGVSQESFGKKIKLSKHSISAYENGDRFPTDRAISDISRVYSVSEEWLRTGRGEMFLPQTEEATIERLENILSDENAFAKRMIQLIATLGVEEWNMLEKMVDKLANNAIDIESEAALKQRLLSGASRVDFSGEKEAK